MPRRRDARTPPALEIKTARLDGLRVMLNTAEREALAGHVDTLFADTPDFFAGELAWFDASRLEGAAPDWTWLTDRLRGSGLRPVGVEGAAADQIDAIRAAGLIALPARTASPPREPREEPLAAEVDPVPIEVDRAEAGAPEPLPPPTTRIIDKPLRSGQRIHAAGDIVILAAVNPGAEVIADGNIHVYAPLMGRALAGARGQTDARIFALRLEAELVSIAGVYRTFEHGATDAFTGQAVQIRLTEHNTLDIAPLQLSTRGYS